MLQQLRIENYVLIDSLCLDLKKGMTAITGETGAGKSILLGALNLLLGGRADRKSFTDQAKKSVIEGVFAIADYGLQPLFESFDLDYDAHALLRREILPSGRSRAFVNDTPTTLEVLHELGAKLVDIHAQRETQRLDDRDFQMELLDSLAEDPTVLTAYQKLYQTYVQRQRLLLQKQAQRAQQLKTRDFNHFLLTELQSAELQADEESQWEAERKKLDNVSRIKADLEVVRRALDMEEYGVLHQLRQSKNALSQLVDLGPSYAEMASRMEAVLIELQDMLRELEDAQEEAEDDPKRLQWIEDRLRLIFDLKQKHRVDSVAELLDIQEKTALELQELQASDAVLEGLESEIKDLKFSLNKTSEALHNQRLQSSNILEKSLTDTLSLLAMPDARVAISVDPLADFKPDGRDAVCFRFAADKGSALQPLQRVASGGEKSRVMLAVKRLMAERVKLPTLIFDEIDTGVSGKVADQMARIMKEMGRANQLIAITHLPQVASRADWQLKVFKEVRGQAAVSRIAPLAGEARVRALAEMLSGRAVSRAALHQAEELLQSD